MRPRITVVIPAHPQRAGNGMLTRALDSVARQTYLPAAVSVAMDLDRQGASYTRQRGLDAVRTEWTGFLDSDDEAEEDHLQVLADAAEETGADYLFTWFTVYDAAGRPRLDMDPFKVPPTHPNYDPRWPEGHFGRPFDPANPRQTTVTTLVRTELAKTVRFAPPPEDETVPGTPHRAGEDWIFTLGCIEQGAKIVHVPRRTWRWHHHSRNSSGMPGQGDAA